MRSPAGLVLGQLRWLGVLKDAREVGQACLDKHRCGQGLMVMQGSQSLQRAEAMTRSLVRPNSRLQCQHISISNFMWGLGGVATVPTGTGSTGVGSPLEG